MALDCKEEAGVCVSYSRQWVSGTRPYRVNCFHFEKAHSSPRRHRQFDDRNRCIAFYVIDIKVANFTMWTV